LDNPDATARRQLRLAERLDPAKSSPLLAERSVIGV